ncbi:MAG: ATP-grasp domain-containing protein [Akkermansiaceae bacterium]|nr:ATP-grasp domain-containing protein [Armatimonadota bacterium]
MPTLLLPPRMNEDTRRLNSAAWVREGWAVVHAQSWRLPPDIRYRPPIVVYGDPLFVDLAASALHLAMLEPPTDWLPNLPFDLRKRNIVLTTLAGARTVSEPTFIKPAEDKSFPAGVYADSVALLAVTPGLPDDWPVLLSEPVTWEVEYRVFALDGKPMTISPYFRDGKLVYEQLRGWLAPPEEQAEALAFATGVLNDTSTTLPSGAVLDVGIIAGRGFAVVEANPAWASGLYGCDPADALAVVAASVCPRSDLAPSQVRFARPAVVVEP